MLDRQTLCARTRDVLPSDFEVLETLGKGSNNRALRVTWEGATRVMRVPRRRSDTQRRGSAYWEYAHTARAAELGCGPALHAAWYARHADGDWTSGLYLVMDEYPYDLETLFEDEEARERVLELRPAISDALAGVLERLARDRLFVFDLKPTNVVVSLAPEVDVRVIDYGRDFCEWGGGRGELDVRTPHVDMAERLADGDAERATHVLFATMLVQLAATTARCLYDDRHDHRMDREARAEINPAAPLARALLDGMRRGNVALVREMLRADEVCAVLQHYNGRRNAGTGRTLRFARAVGC